MINPALSGSSKMRGLVRDYPDKQGLMFPDRKAKWCKVAVEVGDL
jgi:hypothetical protein